MTESESDPRPEATTPDLVREALEQARELLQTEFALARDEMRRELRAFRVAVVSLAAATALGGLGVAFLLMAFLIGTFGHVLPALILGAALLAVAVALVRVGIAALPKRPLHETSERVETDLRVLKERIA